MEAVVQAKMLRPFILLALCLVSYAVAQFEIDYEHDTFLMNGKPFRYVSGSLHYFRLPRQYWRDRLRKLKAAGLNAVSTYVEWSQHEPEIDQYDFSGDKNIVEFIKTAEEEGLYVILRVGPYICAERTMGGFPYWLLRENPDVKLRVNDPNFTKYLEKWLNVFLPIVDPYLFGNGGPIITVQVENEYGFYSTCDKEYTSWLAQVFKNHIQDKAVLFTTDGSSYGSLSCGKIPGVYATVDFGPGANVTEMKANHKAVEPRGPFVNSEFYPGWLTHWGENWARRDTDGVLNTLKDILNLEGNLNFYMFYGGSNFGFTAGANEGPYKSDVTSYDYDAPITEAGDLTSKYMAIRDYLLNFFALNTTLPEDSPKGNYGILNLRSVAKFASNTLIERLGRRFTSDSPQTFEAISQDDGFVLYQVTSPVSAQNIALETDARDYSHIYINGKLVGTLNREFEQRSLDISVTRDDEISILVENLGRINFGGGNNDAKGLLSDVKLGDNVLHGWRETGYNFTQISQVIADCSNDSKLCSDGFGFTVYTGTFKANVTSNIEYNGETFPADTFLDVTGLTKGLVFVNGFNLGRYWTTRGPLYSVYVPGVLLKAEPEENTIILIEEELDSDELSVPFVVNPIYGNPKN